jgi:hypothetical protein
MVGNNADRNYGGKFVFLFFPLLIFLSVDYLSRLTTERLDTERIRRQHKAGQPRAEQSFDIESVNDLLPQFKYLDMVFDILTLFISHFKFR